MTRLLFIIILGFSFIPKESFAQRTADCTISLNSGEIEREAENYLNSNYEIIHIIFILENSFAQDSLFLAWEKSKSLKAEERSSIQLVDSVIVKLSNGLSWNLKKAPPQKPANFIVKFFTKKAKTDQETIDYIKYLEFCSRWEKSKHLCEISDEYTVYTRVIIDGIAPFRAKYELSNNPSKAILQKLMLIDRK